MAVPKLYDLARMTTVTTGTGTITLNAAALGFLTFAQAGITDGDTITYGIEDGTNREIGRGVYTAAGTTLTRTVLKSTNSNSAISLSGSAQVFICVAAEDLSLLTAPGTSGQLIIGQGATSAATWNTMSGDVTITNAGVTAIKASVSLTTPNINVATATSINKVAITAPATSATLTIANGKTFTASNTLTLSGTDSSTLAIGSGGTLTGSSSSAIFYDNIPIASKSAAYTTVLGDANTCIYHPSSDNNARTFTIDSNANVAYPVGTCLTFINDINTVTIAITSDTLVLAGTGSTGSRTLSANGMATAVKLASTRWMISGTGLS